MNPFAFWTKPAAFRTGLAVIAIALLQLIGITVPWVGYIAFLVPVMMIPASSIGQRNQNRAGRVYLLFFLVGVSSLVVEAVAIQDAWGEAQANGDTAAVPLLIAHLPSLVIRMLVAFGCGVAAYVILADTDEAASATAASEEFLERFATWLADNDAPEEVRQAIEMTSEKLGELQDQYDGMKMQARETNDEFAGLATASHQASSAMRDFNRLAEEVHGQLQTLRKEVDGAHADMGQLATQVTEAGEVLDQFATIASHRVLQYAPTDHDADCVVS